MPPKDRKLEQLARIAEDSDNLIVYAANLVSWSKGEIEDFEKRKILLFIGYSDEVTCNKCHKQPCTVNPKIVEYPDGQKKGVCYCTDPEQGGRIEFELDELKYWEINKTKLKELGCYEEPETQDETEKTQYVFRKQGNKWIVVFDYGETLYMDDLKGMGYIARLLTEPNRPIAACDLATNYVALEVQYNNVDIEADGLATDTSIQQLADNDALKDCYKRLQAIPAEIDKAKQNSDHAEQERLKKEKAGILDYVKNSTGLGKNPKAFEGNVERARKSVSKAITTAIAKFEKDNSTLFSHLTNSITLGTNCIYSPETLQDWIL